MSLTPIEELHEKIRSVQRRRKVILCLRIAGLGLASLVALFLIVGFIEMLFQFAPLGRIILLFVLLVGAGVFAWWHVRSVRRLSSDVRHLAHYVEDHIPDLEQRLMTSMEFDENEEMESPELLEKLWEDASIHVKKRNIQHVTTSRPAWYAASAATLMICLLLFAVWSSPRFSRASQQVIWPWAGPEEKMTLPVNLTVEPGDTRIRRGEDVTIIATVQNAFPEQVHLYLQKDRVNWERLPMHPEGPQEGPYAYYVSSINQDLSYYVDIGSDRSRQYRISVFDIPRIKQIDVDYIYPKHTGMKKKTEKKGGDIVAPEGTQIVLHVTFDKPVQRASLKFDRGEAIDLDPDGNLATGSFTVTADATYMIEATDHENLKNEDPAEYFVRSVPDSPPELIFTRPGRDLHVMPLEEVSIAATAKDDYGLTKFALHYSLAKGEDREVLFLQKAIQQLNVTVDGKTFIYFEDLKVEPGDFVTYYLTAADNNGIKGPSEVISDIYFLEVISTEEEFRRASQQMGGGAMGGQGQRSSALVENQKNIIAATWKLLTRGKRMDTEKFDEEVNIIAESQRKVMQRTQMSLMRLAERLSFSDESYDKAVNHLKKAVEHMEAASEKLSSQLLKEALGPEQAALQAILKSEAESRSTEIRMVRNRGGGMGGNRQMREREDLSELFEMEMGRLENRYELPRQTSGAEQQNAQDDTLTKLQELARRQERLNRAQRDLARRQDMMTQEQKRRRLEELSREQEKLSRQAGELSRRWSSLTRQEGGQLWSNRQRQLDQAARQMEEAARSLRQEEPGLAAAKSRKALENLRDQERELSRQQTASISDLVNALNRKAWDLQEREKEILKNMQGMKRKLEDDSPGLEFQVSKEMQGVLAGKEQLQRDLGETEEMLRKVGARGKQKHPEVSRRAVDALRLLRSEGIEDRIEESQEMLHQGLLNLSMDMENRIENSIDRLSKRLQELDQATPKSRDEQIQQAATDARNLRRELENLQQQVEALRKGNQGRQRALSQLEQQQGQGQVREQSRLGQDRGMGLEQMRDSLQHIRRYARGLLRPWARGERWVVDARSIHRELTQKEIEDFLNQPDLWKPLLEPIRELESRLRAQAEISQLKNKLFTTKEQGAPTAYEQLVEQYYRALSEETVGKN